MTIKKFDFPSFEEWNKTQEYTQRIGDYTCTIEIIAFDYSGKIVDYEAAIANYIANMYVNKVFCKRLIRCDVSDEKTLKEWYEAVIVKLNDKWKNFILETYFCEEETI